MRLVDFLDKGASLHPGGAPCLTPAAAGGRTLSYVRAGITESDQSVCHSNVTLRIEIGTFWQHVTVRRRRDAAAGAAAQAMGQP